MASLKCSNCGNGIHYHDEANGTQFIVFGESEWNELIASDLPTSRYLLDGTQKYYYVWKCDKCGSLHVFEAESNSVRHAYRKCETLKISLLQEETYIAYSDVDWDVITEDTIQGSDIEKHCPDSRRIRALTIGDDIYVFYDDAEEELAVHYVKI